MNRIPDSFNNGLDRLKHDCYTFKEFHLQMKAPFICIVLFVENSVTKLSVYYPRIYGLFRTFNTKQTKADCTFK